MATRGWPAGGAGATSAAWMTTAAAPSPRTNPARSAANGRQASPGWSRHGASTPMRQKLPRNNGWIVASAATTSTVSAWPARMSRAAWATATRPLAQAATTASQGPPGRKFSAIAEATQAGVPLDHRAPLPSAPVIGLCDARCAARADSTPALLVPVTTAEASRRIQPGGRAASRSASSAAKMASAAERSGQRSVSSRSTAAGGSSATGICWSGFGRPASAPAHRPSRQAWRASSAHWPAGQIKETPVMTGGDMWLAAGSPRHPG